MRRFSSSLSMDTLALAIPSHRSQNQRVRKVSYWCDTQPLPAVCSWILNRSPSETIRYSVPKLSSVFINRANRAIHRIPGSDVFRVFGMSHATIGVIRHAALLLPGIGDRGRSA